MTATTTDLGNRLNVKLFLYLENLCLTEKTNINLVLNHEKPENFTENKIEIKIKNSNTS